MFYSNTWNSCSSERDFGIFSVSPCIPYFLKFFQIIRVRFAGNTGLIVFQVNPPVEDIHMEKFHRALGTFPLDFLPIGKLLVSVFSRERLYVISAYLLLWVDLACSHQADIRFSKVLFRFLHILLFFLFIPDLVEVTDWKLLFLGTCQATEFHFRDGQKSSSFVLA